MKVEIAVVPPRGKAFSIAFLHEARDASARAPESVRAALAQACRATGFRGREKEIAAASTARGGWTLVGLGKAPASVPTIRRALRRAVRDALRHSDGRVLLAFDGGLDARRMRAVVREAAQTDYRFDRYKSRPRKDRTDARATILLPPGVAHDEVSQTVKDAPVLAQAIRWARDLGNTPANDLGPAEFAREARAMARGSGVSVRALDRRQIARERMGGLLAVSSGSVRPPVFLIGEHRPARARGTAVLVGKGITFDSGGISIKPAASMGEMKYDMMGAATVFACLFAARGLDIPVHVVALAPLTENLPSGSACRPGDILRMRNGKTVEVDNTDAEGRLVLADALSYAEKFRPDVLLDYATLTGAVLIALGHDCAGLMTPEDDLARELVAAGEETGERLWRLPVWDEYRPNLKSEWADMKNTGGRVAGTINAAVFLKEFVPEGPAWAHLDIAGVAHLEKEHAGYDTGATGFGVAMTIEFLRRRFGREKR
ncbi:MAG: leucyl aminopeptidase [Acidobacteriota bacterium]|nr:leucyl aminopeptidase [Acidobacteriota bacterium]